MKHVRMLGLCLVAVLAVSAVASASAFAEGRPEYKHCGKAPKVGKTYEGNYSDKACAVPTEHGKYQREEIAEGTEYTGKSKAVTINVNGKAIICKKSTEKGSILDQFESSLTITLSSCGINGNKKEPCGTAGTITTDPLTTELYFDNAEENEAGEAFFGTEGVFASFACGAENFTIEGILIGAVGNTKKGNNASFAVSGGKQAHQGIWFFESEIEGHLTSGESEVTVSGTLEQGPKGDGVYL